MKAEGHLGRCYLKGRAGDAANVILSAVGHKFRRILAWLRELLGLFLGLQWRMLAFPATSTRLLNGRLNTFVAFRTDPIFAGFNSLAASVLQNENGLNRFTTDLKVRYTDVLMLA
ncbi:hypothetical protein AC628_05670 [Bradyrhizobium sp. NAS96.2]|nr:hypothetical protein AC628_05670 [Bradyrhizobium sp. NAS96.2]